MTITRRLDFAALVDAEYSEAVRMHDPINSAHEGYAVILEELDEFWDECRKKRAARSPRAMLNELVQIAAMAQRTAYDLGLIERTILDAPWSDANGDEVERGEPDPRLGGVRASSADSSSSATSAPEADR